MRLVTFLQEGTEKIGAVMTDGRILDFAAADPRLAVDMLALIQEQDRLLPLAQAALSRAPVHAVLDPAGVALLAPIPRPVSMRDGYAFRQHVATARRNRGLDMLPEFDLFPVTYFTNHLAVTGPGEVLVQDHHLARLDYELEVAIVTGRPLRNATLEEADEAIFGYLVMNDWSARALQLEEMKLSLGPCKGKDFATSLGPWLVTRDEVRDPQQLHLWLDVNGERMQDSTTADMIFSCAEIVSYVSRFMTLLPGDVICTGTPQGVGMGRGRFLQIGYQVKLGVEGLGEQQQTVVAAKLR